MNTKSTSNAIKVLAIWNIGLLLYFLFQVKFVEARYILMLVPSVIVLASVFFLQSWNWVAKSTVSIFQRRFFQGMLAIFAIVTLVIGLQQWYNWSDYHRNREYTTASVIGGKWLSENIPDSLSIYCDQTSYLPYPEQFSQIFREKQCRLSKVLELQTDIVMLVNSRYTQYVDSSSIQNFLLNTEKFWDIHYFYHAFQDSVYQNYQLWKDFEGARIYRKTQD